MANRLNRSFSSLWIAWRIVRARKGVAGLSLMTVVSIGGVMIGVAALIVVLSVMAGFEFDLKAKMLRGQPHLEITSQNAALGYSLNEYPAETFLKRLKGAQEWEPYIQTDVVLKQSKHLSSVTLFGVDPSREGHLWGFGDALTEGDFADLSRTHMPLFTRDGGLHQWPGIILGEDLAIQLGANVGDEIIALNPQGVAEVGSVLAGGTLSRHFVLVGTFRTGLFNYDGRWGVVDLAQARKFMADYDESLDVENYVSGVAINFADPFDMPDVEKALADFSDLNPLSWQKANKSLLFALKLEKFTMGSILMLIVLVAAFSISGTMMMNVFHRRNQVALLRAVGMSKSGVARLFLVQGFFVATMGISLGVLLGLGICKLLTLSSISLPTGVYQLQQMPVRYLPGNYVVICAFTWLLSLAATTLPALTAASQEPSEGLRWS